MKTSQKIGFFIESGKQEFPWLPLSAVARFFKKQGFQVLGFTFDHLDGHKKFKKLFDSFHLIKETSDDFDFNVAVELSKKIKKERLKIMFFSNYRFTSLLVTTKYLAKGKLKLIYLQERPFSEINQDRYHSLRSNQLDAWVTPNTAAMQEVRAGANIEFSKLHVIARPLRVSSKIISHNSQNPVREKLGIDENALVVGIFINHSLDIGRDFARLLTRISSEPELRSTAVFLVGINGNSNFRREVKEAVLNTASESGLSRNLFYFGKRRLVFAKDGADVMFLLTSEEPFSGAAALAKLHGLPCLGFKSGMLSEVLSDYPFQSLNGFEEKSELYFELEILKKMRHYGMTQHESRTSKRKRKEYLSSLLALAKALPQNRKTLY